MTTRCDHHPGIVVELIPGEEVHSTCMAECNSPIVQRYEHIGDEDRVPGWGRWKATPVWVARPVPTIPLRFVPLELLRVA